jgi:hypothetical protein
MTCVYDLAVGSILYRNGGGNHEQGHPVSSHANNCQDACHINDLAIDTEYSDQMR